jgi:hypothetical protein
MKIIKKDKLIEIGIVSVLSLIVIVFAFKLYGEFIPAREYNEKVISLENEVEIGDIEIEDLEVKDLEVKDEDIIIVEDDTVNGETIEGKTLVIVKEEKPVVPEVPEVTNKDDLTDSTKEPEYEEVPKVEENEEIENNVIKVETKTNEDKEMPEGVNTVPADDSDNPFTKLGLPPSGNIEGVDSSEYSEDGVWGTGDKF